MMNSLRLAECVAAAYVVPRVLGSALVLPIKSSISDKT